MQLLSLALVIAITQSCEVEIPLEDSTPPKFSFRITGDGFDHTFDQHSNFDDIQLNLRLGTTYKFTFSGGDAGGLEHILWSIHGGEYFIFDPIAHPWTLTEPGSRRKNIEWRGNRSSATTGAIVSGQFTTTRTIVIPSFQFSVSDFGGERRTPNRIFRELYVFIGDHPTEIDVIYD